MLRRLTIFVLAALCIGIGAHAQDVQPVPPLSGRVIDSSGTLTPPQIQALTDKLSRIEAQHGSQLVVLMVPTTQPEDIAAYAQRVGDAWKIGRKEVGDGVLIVVAKNDRKVRIEVAKALEGAIPDLAARQIITERISPAFKAGDYAGGLNAAIDRLAARIGTEGLPEPRVKTPASRHGFDFQDLGVFLFLGVPVAGALLTGLLGRKLGALATGGAAGVVGWVFTASTLAAFGVAALALVLVGVLGVGSSRRGGGLPMPWGGGGWGSSGGGGGFSSGGGGDFGGGGASGDW